MCVCVCDLLKPNQSQYNHVHMLDLQRIKYEKYSCEEKAHWKCVGLSTTLIKLTPNNHIDQKNNH